MIISSQPTVSYQGELGAYGSINEKLKEVKSNGQKLLSSPISLYIKDYSDVIKEELITKSLGNGGCKRAVQLSGGRALLIPNMDEENAPTINGYWPRVVEEEIQMSQFLQQIGLLGLQLQKVTISSEKDSEYGIPAYVTDSFDSLKEKNIFILDTKNSDSSTWDHKLFKTCEDRENLENWRPVIEFLTKDIGKLAHYELPLYGDSLNLAIVKNEEGNNIRYFGFDYTSKTNKNKIPNIKGRSIEKHEDLAKLKEQSLFEDIKRVFSRIINKILWIEYEAGRSLPKEAWDLERNLVEKYSNDIFEEVRRLQKT